MRSGKVTNECYSATSATSTKLQCDKYDEYDECELLCGNAGYVKRGFSSAFNPAHSSHSSHFRTPVAC